ncbi:hypothetical protein ACET3Z_007538 [Daucus carota]
MAPSFPIEFTGRKESENLYHSHHTQLMGKSRKVSKGYSSGFIPDYRHAVETMAESEGFGSSGRVDAEFTGSDDSCAPKRKCISLNVESYDQLGVPVTVLPLSTMSQSERKDLEVRLQHELEQVRILQKKIAFMSSSVVALSPTSDIHSCSDGQRKLFPDAFPRSVGVSASKGKKRVPTGRNGSRTKHPTAFGRVEPAKQGMLPSASHAMLMNKCETLLQSVMKHQHGWVFNAPVDVVKLNIPDYYTVIKHPMDLGTVKSKLVSGQYSSPLEFAADVRLTFSNAKTYNPPGNDVHVMADVVSKYFEVRWKPIEKKIPVIVDVSAAPSRSNVRVEAEITNVLPPTKKKKITSFENIVRQEPVKRIMTGVEKQKLSMELEALLNELPESIIDFLKEKSSNGEQTNEDEIEIDIDTLGDDNLFTLRDLLNDYMAEKRKHGTKVEACEIELHNESGFSNSSVQPCKGNDLIEEDIDIGGNDLPITSFPPVEIEKDTALRNSKCSSSSSSSSDSGSSSSDSDSGSSSGSELGGAKASAPADTTKDTLAPGATIEVRKSDTCDPSIEKDSLNNLNQVVPSSQSKPVSVESDDRQEGESAPPERQVSPEKLYRAALLRNRFADTILKAQERTLGKVEIQDPERLRLEKEELEKRMREEKARLQAEAKAAEEARKKAEAEAAAEGRRKRELEREAARQALQKMEKTVEINENCQFLEDLEMLRVDPAEQIQGFVDETSPDRSLAALGSFKFQGNTNPLEQLGLYMKADDEEDEEGDPSNVPPAVDDPEEGEID